MEPRKSTLADLENIDGYSRLFTAVDFWTPYVQQVCERHGLAPCHSIRIGVPGTCPTFIVDERWVVKFFGRLFDGQACFAAEQEAGRLTAADPAIRTAKVIGSGALGGEGWPWPYLIFDYIPGISFGEAREGIRLEDKLRAARDLGDTMRRIHALPLAGSPVFPDSYAPYRQFLDNQRAACLKNQRQWGALPAHLLAQIETFLPPVETLIDQARPPHLIHADLTRDHLLGRVENDRWTCLALIDFGDAMTGNLFYELAALHLDLFGSDKRLLNAFLEAYGISAAERATLPRKALAAALLHRFNVFERVPKETWQAETAGSGNTISTLEELAEALWGV